MICAGHMDGSADSCLVSKVKYDINALSVFPITTIEYTYFRAIVAALLCVNGVAVVNGIWQV